MFMAGELMNEIEKKIATELGYISSNETPGLIVGQQPMFKEQFFMQDSQKAIEPKKIVTIDENVYKDLLHKENKFNKTIGCLIATTNAIEFGASQSSIVASMVSFLKSMGES